VRWSRAALVFASVLALAAVACRVARAPASVPQVIVLGIDGMDPNFVERHWDALPNLARLRQQGSFSRLGTTMPPQSPVAWSTFITGLEPDQHGIYDFVHRDAATLEPFSSMGRTEEPRFTLPLGPYLLPLSSSRLVSFRHGTAFWQTLAPELIQTQLLPQLASQPAVAEHAWPPQLQTAQPNLCAVHGIGGKLAIVREQTHRGEALFRLVEYLQRLSPRRLLLIVDLAEIQDRALRRFAAGQPSVLDDAEVAMVLAVFLAIRAAQKHASAAE